MSTTLGARVAACAAVALLRVLNPVTTPALAQEGGTRSALGVSNALNPAISFNALFLGTWSDNPVSDPEGGTKDGLAFQEAEVVLSSVVDPYFQAFATVTLSPEEGTGLEEGYAWVTSLPSGAGLKFGQLKLPFGKHNELHTHAFPWVSAPIGTAGLLGPEGANDVAVVASYLLPTSIYLELQGYAGDGSAEIMDAEEDRLATGGRLSSLLDLGTSATIEIGGSLLSGPAGAEDAEQRSLRLDRNVADLAPVFGLASRVDTEDPEIATYVGGDLTLKWQDLTQTGGRALIWQSELISGRFDQDRNDQLGAYSLLRWKALRRVWLSGGYALFRESLAEGEDFDIQETRAQVAFVPSEFSLLRLEVRHRDWSAPEIEDDWTANLQLNFTIGSHPAHRY
ncbi:MAG: hypothetical protein IT349_05070 [Candidatus Eisenbacteria bacterium]|nr:hypothetical protein [Candidatus Eisenbacteria bacterium]MCC7141455.1 hypothetical protein [Candidatus Eisenbacteria bacterium]